MLLELFSFVILKNAMAFLYAYFFSDFLRFDTSLLLLTVTLPGVSNKHCLLSLYSLTLITCHLIVYQLIILYPSLQSNRVEKVSEICFLHPQGIVGELCIMNMKILIDSKIVHNLYHNFGPFNLACSKFFVLQIFCNVYFFLSLNYHTRGDDKFAEFSSQEFISLSNDMKTCIQVK